VIVLFSFLVLVKLSVETRGHYESGRKFVSNADRQRR
jgi:hypothetical protein